MKKHYRKNGYKTRKADEGIVTSSALKKNRNLFVCPPEALPQGVQRKGMKLKRDRGLGLGGFLWKRSAVMDYIRARKLDVWATSDDSTEKNGT